MIADGDDRILIHDYFKVVKRPSLASPDGASLSDDVIAALAGPGHEKTGHNAARHETAIQRSPRTIRVPAVWPTSLALLRS